MASSFQSSSSSSTSEPIVVRTPENDILNQLSAVAAGLANQMVGWAQGVFAQTSQITDQAVGNFFRVSQQMGDLSNNLTDQYNNVFAPQNRSLAREADSYNSVARQRLNMGQAGAQAAMAGDNQLRAAEESLRSYGINPSDGRYAALDKAAAVQNAANIAGAQNMQRDRDIATGQRLRSEAVQVGAMLPAAIANVNNTAIQANTGASNATLANANTGANLQRLPNEYLKTAMDLKLPLMGQKSQSQGSSSGSSSSPDRGGGGGGSGGGGPGGGYGGYGGGGGGPAWMPQHGDAQERFSQRGGGGGGGIRPGSMARFQPVNPNSYSRPDYELGSMYDWQKGFDPNNFSGPMPSADFSGYSSYDGYNMNVGDPYSNENVPYIGNDYYDNPFMDSGFGQEFNYGDPYQSYSGDQSWSNTNWGNIDYNADANAYDPGWGTRYDQPNQDTNWGNGADPYTGGYSEPSSGSNSAFQDYYGGGSGGGYSGGFDGNNFSGYSTTSADTTSPASDYYAGDYSGNFEDYGGAYAQGGAVPFNASPSGGAITDDVPAMSPQGPAQLNAGEFVIPQDVALWKGQEFFQKLIDQSRQRNSQASAKPQMQAMR